MKLTSVLEWDTRSGGWVVVQQWQPCPAGCPWRHMHATWGEGARNEPTSAYLAGSR